MNVYNSIAYAPRVSIGQVAFEQILLIERVSGQRYGYSCNKAALCYILHDRLPASKWTRSGQVNMSQFCSM